MVTSASNLSATCPRLVPAVGSDLNPRRIAAEEDGDHRRVTECVKRMAGAGSRDATPDRRERWPWRLISASGHSSIRHMPVPGRAIHGLPLPCTGFPQCDLQASADRWRLLAVNAPTTNLTSYPEPVPACPPAPNTAQALVKYFDERKGFWRYGRLLASRTLRRGRQKGQTILLIETALHQHVTRNGDEVEWVH
jgi:hypothetical protein